MSHCSQVSRSLTDPSFAELALTLYADRFLNHRARLQTWGKPRRHLGQKSRNRPRPLAPSHQYPPARNPTRTAPTNNEGSAPSSDLASQRARRTYITISSLFALTISAYTANLLTTLSRQEPHIPSDADDPSAAYDHTAPLYDDEVEGTETWTGIETLRRSLIAAATGNVLEVCAGTGRNAAFYDFSPGEPSEEVSKRGLNKKRKGNGRTPLVTSIDFSDQSSPMLRIAREKWEKLYPGSSTWDGDNNAENSTSLGGNLTTVPPSSSGGQQSSSSTSSSSALPPLSPESSAETSETKARPSGEKKIHFMPLPISSLNPSTKRYDTVIQTFGLCSLGQPLDHLHSLLCLLSTSQIDKPADNPSSPSKLLLLEHGRSHHPLFAPPLNYILDRSSTRHAAKWGCWWNRDIRAIVREAEAKGWIEVEECTSAWWQGGTVWLVVGRRGAALQREEREEEATRRRGGENGEDEDGDVRMTNGEAASRESRWFGKWFG